MTIKYLLAKFEDIKDRINCFIENAGVCRVCLYHTTEKPGLALPRPIIIFVKSVEMIKARGRGNGIRITSDGAKYDLSGRAWVLVDIQAPPDADIYLASSGMMITR